MKIQHFLRAMVLLALASAGALAEDVPTEVIQPQPVFTNMPKPEDVQLYIAPPYSISGSIVGSVADPLQPFNRSMYTFNAYFDRWVFLPVADGYQWIMPDFAEKGVNNFFGNLGEIRNFTNNVLQLHGKDTGVTASRFLINSTIGLFGLFDPATKFGLHRCKEDFGQTLGYWGVGAGPYLVLPFLGPSGLRDAGGMAFDYSISTAVDPLNVNGDANKDELRIETGLLQAVDTRANTAFRYYHTGSPFEYALVRYAYTRMREVEVAR
jgi:phospholipid-binding lipoprotein MlaA